MLEGEVRAAAPELIERAHRAIVEGIWSHLRFVPGARRQDWAGAVALRCALPSPLANVVIIRVLSSGPDLALDRYAGFFGDRTPWRLLAREPAAGAIETRAPARGLRPGTGEEGRILTPLPPVPDPPTELAIAEVADADALRDFRTAAAAGFAIPRWAMRALAPRPVLRRSASEPWPHLLVGRVAGRPVATSALTISEGVGTIQFVATVPSARHRGYGRQLTWAAIAAARRAGADAVVLQPTPAGERMYARMGFLPALAYRAWHAPPGAGAGAVALVRALWLSLRP